MKSKKLLSILLSIFMLIGTIGSFSMKTRAEKVLKNGDYQYEVLTKNTVAITKYTGSAKNLTIPSTINKKKVTLLSNDSFIANSKLESVVIPKGVSQIGMGTFAYCTKLKNISIPNSVKYIGQEAFTGCLKLNKLSFPDSVTSIGDIVIDDTGYYNTKSNWKNGVLYVSNHLIEAKRSVKGNYSIKKGTKSIADYAFEGCAISSVTIPSSLVDIGYLAFESCSKLKIINYKGTIAQWKKIKSNIQDETLTNKIILCSDGALKPSIPSAKIKALVSGNKSLKVNWSKVNSISGYEVQIATDNKFSKNKKIVTIKKPSTTSTTIKNLKAKKKYYVRIRDYKIQKVNGKNKKVYSYWSGTKSVITK